MERFAAQSSNSSSMACCGDHEVFVDDTGTLGFRMSTKKKKNI